VRKRIRHDSRLESNRQSGGLQPCQRGNYAIVAKTVPDAIYKGLAIATDASNAAHLYATNFHAGTVDVFDGSFTLVHFSDTALVRNCLKATRRSTSCWSVGSSSSPMRCKMRTPRMM